MTTIAASGRRKVLEAVPLWGVRLGIAGAVSWVLLVIYLAFGDGPFARRSRPAAAGSAPSRS
jgi:hypothetical protein